MYLALRSFGVNIDVYDDWAKKDEVKEVGLPCIRYGEIYTKYNHKFDKVQTYIEEGVTEVKVSSGTLFMTGSGELLEESSATTGSTCKGHRASLF